LVAAAKFLVAATKTLLVPNFVAVTKPFFPCNSQSKISTVTTIKGTCSDTGFALYVG